jgi:hypothetical protein
MIDPDQPIGPSAYVDWKPKKGPPWKIGYASSYAGNTWRAAVMNRLQNVINPKWKELGLISEVVVTQSNLNDSVQIQQMRQLVDQGVDAIIVCCSNPTALNQTVKYAYDRGVPVFSLTGYLTSPYSVNASTNYQLGGYVLGVGLIVFVNATATTTYLAVIRVPYFLPLGVLSGLASLIPFVGAIVAGSQVPGSAGMLHASLPPSHSSCVQATAAESSSPQRQRSAPASSASAAVPTTLRTVHRWFCMPISPGVPPGPD